MKILECNLPETATVLAECPQETQEFGARLGRAVESGDIICLSGPLGAGKTTMVQGLARGLGSRARVTSPTFTVMHEYEGRLLLYHLDCYRLGGPEDLEVLGVDDWLGKEDAAVIEWPERVLAALPGDLLWIEISPPEGVTRELKICPRGAKSRLLAERAGFL